MTRLSVVVPLFNEEQNVVPLIRSVKAALAAEPAWELVLVDDGSTDGTAAVAAAECGSDPRLRLVRLARNYGQTAAMQAGFDQSTGDVVVSMDGDLQNDPADIPPLLATMQQGYDLVVGYRRDRKDGVVTRRLPSWVANRLIGWLTGVRVRDNGCSLKAYRRELLQRMHLYSDQHRFIPAVAAATAGARIAEIPVNHHPRRFGTSKYGLSRVGMVLADLLVIKMIHSFRERSLLMFSLGGAAAVVVGLAFTVAAGVAIISFSPEKANAFVLPGAAMVWFGLACYLLMLGLISEVVLRDGMGQVTMNGGKAPLASEVTW